MMNHGGLGSPLSGRSILVTRAAHQSPSTAAAIRNRGARPLLLPCLEVVYHAAAIDRALQALGEDDTADVLLTSCNGIDALLSHSSSVELRGLFGHRRRVIAVGEKSAEALRQIGVHDVMTPELFSQQGVAAWWDRHGWPQRLIFVRAEQGRDDLLPLLQQRPCSVQLHICYGSRVPDSPPPAAIVQQLAAGEVDAVLLGSSATARGLIVRVGIDLARQPLAVAISDRVADAAVELGLRVQVVAAQASFDAMLDRLADYFGGTV